MLKTKTKTLLAIMGIGCLLAHSIVILITFLYAYFYNNYIFIANINGIGEAHFELILIPITIILGMYGILYVFKKLVTDPAKEAKKYRMVIEQ